MIHILIAAVFLIGKQSQNKRGVVLTAGLTLYPFFWGGSFLIKKLCSVCGPANRFAEHRPLLYIAQGKGMGGKPQEVG